MTQAPSKTPGVRLQRILAAAGVGARRACERLIEEGRVTVNGERVRSLPAFADPRHDRITVDGRPIASAPARHVYVMVNKPERTLVTSADEPGMDRATVMDLVSHPDKKRLFPVGRLDFATTGLVLLTSDGALANRLTHPRYGVPRTYRAVVKGSLDAPAIARLRAALLKELRRSDRAAARVRPGGGSGGAIEVRPGGLDQGRAVLEIEVREGRTGNLGTMLAATGVGVRKLERVAIGPLRLSNLARGRWRELERDEIRALRDLAKGVVRPVASPGRRRRRGTGGARTRAGGSDR